MNLLGIVLVVFCFTKAINTAPTPCEPEDAEDEVCDETDYEAYRKCIEESRANREKRQVDPCLPKVVEPIVQTMEPFAVLVPVPPQKIAQWPMLKNLDRTVIVKPDTNQIDIDENGGDDDDVDNFHYVLPLNVTTVIRLTNIVNNTNNIHMPTTLNNTNVNNINIYSNLTEVDRPGASAEEGQNCCTAVRPQSCHTSTQGVRCKHRKFQTCGAHCTAKVIHVQKRKRCRRSTGECQEKIAYVPQPEKPTCVYIEEWPYVVCGKQANMSVICAGCYDHYGRGYEAVHGHPRMQPQCYGCYDDAFEMGPLYRRGPVLRPFYYHQPPCYLSGSCPEDYADCGYGCYGHERIDPAWGPADTEQYDPPMDSSNTIYYDPDDLEPSDDPSQDWGVPSAKCAVVTDGNAITLKNCTSAIDNPYLAAPAMYPYYNKMLKRKSTTPHPTTSTTTTDTPGTDRPTTEGDAGSTITKPPETTHGSEEEEEEEDDNSPTTVGTREENTASTTSKPEEKATTAGNITNPGVEPDDNETDDPTVDGSGAGAGASASASASANVGRFVADWFADDEDFVL